MRILPCKILYTPSVRLSPKSVIDTFQFNVMVVVLPYFVIKDEDKLGNVFNVIFPFVEGTIVGVLHCCGFKSGRGWRRVENRCYFLRW